MDVPAAAPDVTATVTNPLLIVAGTLLAVLAVTFLITAVGGGDSERSGGGPGNLAGAASAGSCGQGTPADATYAIDVAATPDPPRPEGTTFLLTIRHDGKTVTGAKVCLTTDMPDMEHSGLNAAVKETSGGRYETRIQFGMGGTWKTGVTIAEPGKPVVSVPLTIQVAQVEAN